MAGRLNRDAGSAHIPALFFLTDPDRTPAPERIAGRLPRGTAVIYRHFGAPTRARTARQLARICRSRSLPLFIAADPELATMVGAQGVHWPERLLHRCQACHGLLITAAAHSAAGVAQAAATGADACLLSPVFQTRSNSPRRPLGLFRASQIARAAPIPVIALGGITAHNCRGLLGRGFAGIAAVDGLSGA